MKSKISIVFFGFWLGAVVVSCFVFFLGISWFEKSFQLAWNETQQILDPTLLLACQIPSLGYLWHSKQEGDPKGAYVGAFCLVPVVYGIFIGIMTTVFYYT